MSNYCTIVTAFDNEDEVKKAGDELLKTRLVSAVQVVESNSRWLWKSEEESAKEYLVLLKTKRNFEKEIYDVIRKYHSYETFEFDIYDIIGGSEEYLNWIDEEIK